MPKRALGRSNSRAHAQKPLKKSLRKNEDKGFIIADSLEGKVEKGKQEKGYKTSSFSCLEAPKLVWGPN